MLRANQVCVACAGFLPSHFRLEFGQFFSQLTDSLLLSFLLCGHLLLLLDVAVLLLADQLLQRKDQSKSQTRLEKNIKGEKTNQNKGEKQIKINIHPVHTPSTLYHRGLMSKFKRYNYTVEIDIYRC